MNSNEPVLDLTMSAQPENLLLARETVGGLLEQWRTEPGLIDDVKTAVTEACGNAIIHAYPEGPDMGLINIAAYGSEAASFGLRVRDFGEGLSPKPGRAGMGVGLPLIGALTDAFELSSGSGPGTEVRMSFGTGDSITQLPPRSADRHRKTLDCTAILAMRDYGLISRFVLAAGSQDELDVDRRSDLQMAVAMAVRDLRPGALAEISVRRESLGVSFGVTPIVEMPPCLEVIRRISLHADLTQGGRALTVQIQNDSS